MKRTGGQVAMAIIAGALLAFSALLCVVIMWEELRCIALGIPPLGFLFTLFSAAMC